jgi:hypothetical protein
MATKGSKVQDSEVQRFRGSQVIGLQANAGGDKPPPLRNNFNRESSGGVYPRPYRLLENRNSGKRGYMVQGSEFSAGGSKRGILSIIKKNERAYFAKPERQAKSETTIRHSIFCGSLFVNLER